MARSETTDRALAYIREQYAVPAVVGARIAYQPGAVPMVGEIIGGGPGASIRVRFNAGNEASLHPTWRVTYLANETEANDA